MYSYKETVKTDIKGWIADEVTGNASGSYTFSGYEARRNFFEDDDSDEYISQMIADGFTISEDVGQKVSESNWELLDVSIRCWLLSQCLSEVLDEMYDV